MTTYAKIFPVKARQRIFPVEAKTRIFNVKPRVRIFTVTKDLGDNVVVTPPVWGPNVFIDFHTWNTPTDQTDYTETIAGSSTINQDLVELYNSFTNSYRADIDGITSIVASYASTNTIPTGIYRLLMVHKEILNGAFQFYFRNDTDGLWLQSDGTWSPAGPYMYPPPSAPWAEYIVPDISMTLGKAYAIYIVRKSTSASSSYWIGDFQIQERL